MKNPFRRKKIPHPDGLDSTFYVQGYTFNGGAEHLAYINTRPHPVLTKYAGILPRKQLRVFEAQTVYQMQSLPVQPIIPGVQAGQLLTQSLTYNGELANSDNNYVANRALFGGVQ